MAGPGNRRRLGLSVCEAIRHVPCTYPWKQMETKMTSFPEVIKLSEATWQVPWTGDACNWLFKCYDL